MEERRISMIDRHIYRSNALRAVAIAALLLCGGATPLATRAADIGPIFRDLWSKTDTDNSLPPVWGPQANTDGLNEAYAEAPGGFRLVQYFDKGRMELGGTPPNLTVTAGLLATEMITAKIQIGDSASKVAKPANVPVAGDPDNIFPTYASLAPLRAAPGPGSTGPVTRLYNPDGTFGVRQEAAGDPAASYATMDGLTGHTVPKAFADFRNDPRHPLTTIGLAITEPVWAKVKVGGVPKDVMLQAFERRVLTYTPSNPDPYKVEFGNIGQHYYRWRYSLDGGEETPIPAGLLPNFRPAYNSQFNPDLGKPLTLNNASTVTYSIVVMEHGIMLYVQPTLKIYALPSDVSGAVFPDTFLNSPDDCTPAKPGPTPGTIEPCRGFGKVWRENPAVKASLGYALAAERGVAGTTEYFENGFMFYDKERDRYWMVNTVQFFARYYPV
jgi:hypothetical protein